MEKFGQVHHHYSPEFNIQKSRSQIFKKKRNYIDLLTSYYKK